MKPDDQQPDPRRLGEVFTWALETLEDPEIAVANWLARDLFPGCRDVVDLLVNAETPPAALDKAKDVFKTLRIVGETAADRRLGGRLYCAAIASALVFHHARISRQSDAALERAFVELADDAAMPEAIRDLARRAAMLLASGGSSHPIETIGPADSSR